MYNTRNADHPSLCIQGMKEGERTVWVGCGRRSTGKSANPFPFDSECFSNSFKFNLMSSIRASTMSGSFIVSSALRRAVASCSVVRSVCVPAVANFKNANQVKISATILSRNFMSSGISLNEEEKDYVAFVPQKVFKMTPITDSSVFSRSSIFVGNLDFSVTEQSILERLEEVLGPNIALRARIAVDRETGTYNLA